MDKPDAQPRTSHLLIAGTGRAGTSFMVRYFAGFGLDTILSRDGDGASWDTAAHAGLEFSPADYQSGRLPYVIKSPWSYEFIDELLARQDLHFDAVIVPVRELAESASSRIIVELRAVYETQPWMAELETSWDNRGITPGGVVYSLDPIDQARILAVGFHRLIERLARAEIPIVFLSFPRMVLDPAYLFHNIRQFLPPSASLARAIEVHHQIADPAKVRTEAELRNEGEPEAMSSAGDQIALPGKDRLHRIALGRELTRVRQLAAAALAEAGAAAAEARTALAETHAALAAARAEARAALAETHAALAAAQAEARAALTETHAARAETRAALAAAQSAQVEGQSAEQRAAAACAALAAATQRASAAEALAASYRQEAETTGAAIAAMRNSRGWRLLVLLHRAVIFPWRLLRGQ